MTGLLASVSSIREARTALEGGVDLLDVKDPAAGVLGAVEVQTVADIARLAAGCVPVSATVGDLPMRPGPLRRAAADVRAAGVDYVKIGFHPGGDWAACAAALGAAARGGRYLVAVLFADRSVPLDFLGVLAAQNFAGAMLDTADKRAGPLPRLAPASTLARFVAECRRLGLLSGLAGALHESNIPPLLALAPDYLGFRGALCPGAYRAGAIDPARLHRVRALIPKPETLQAQ